MTEGIQKSNPTRSIKVVGNKTISTISSPVATSRAHRPRFHLLQVAEQRGGSAELGVDMGEEAERLNQKSRTALTNKLYKDKAYFHA